MIAKLLTADEVAQLLGLRVRTIYRLCQLRRLPHLRLNERCLRFESEAVYKWLENHRKGYWTIRNSNGRLRKTSAAHSS